MIIQQLRKEQYDSLYRDLIKKAHTEPLEASYTVDLYVNDVEYAVKIQPESHRRMAVLQAYRIDRDECGQVFERITRGAMLLAFLELLIEQGVAKKS